MKPRRTPDSNVVFHLPGGNEDNDLWAEATLDTSGRRVICSVWQFTDEERQAVAEGANIELVVWGSGVPPLAVHITDTPLGKSDKPHIVVNPPE